MRTGTATPPAAHTPPGGTWPDTPLVPDAPPVAEYARQFVQRLRAATDIDTMTNRETARTLGFSRTALMRVLRGEGLPSTSMVATLEQRLGVDLWPGGTAIRAQLDQR